MAPRPAASPDEGEIWWVNFDPNLGSEPNKIRPAVVIGPKLPRGRSTRIVVPLTSYQPKHASFPWMVLVKATLANGLRNDSFAEGQLLTTKALEAFQGGSPIGRVTDQEFHAIQYSCLLVTGLDNFWQRQEHSIQVMQQQTIISLMEELGACRAELLSLKEAHFAAQEELTRLKG